MGNKKIFEYMKKGQEAKIICFLGIYSFLVVLFCAGASPIINYMTTDTSVFFLIGRGMKAGVVPYKEMFDHKGFYLYVLNFLLHVFQIDLHWGYICCKFFFPFLIVF